MVYPDTSLNFQNFALQILFVCLQIVSWASEFKRHCRKAFCESANHVYFQYHTLSSPVGKHEPSVVSKKPSTQPHAPTTVHSEFSCHSLLEIQGRKIVLTVVVGTVVVVELDIVVVVVAVVVVVGWVVVFWVDGAVGIVVVVGGIVIVVVVVEVVVDVFVDVVVIIRVIIDVDVIL